MAYRTLSNGNEVRNIEGTHVCLPRGPLQSWKKYWCSESGQNWPDKCRIRGCGERAVGGAHVNVWGSDEVYIIPMCNFHNTPHDTDWHDVNSRTVAVHVDREDTCGPEGICYKQGGNIGRMTNLSLTDNDEVRNLQGTRTCKPSGFKSWKKFWLSKSGQDWPDKCRIYGCGKTAVGGAHVNVWEADEVYIIPMCNFHNTTHDTDWQNVNAGTVAVCREDTGGPDGICCGRCAGER